MANSDKDIIITPNRGQSDDPKIEFRGANTSVGAQTISARVYPTSNGTLSFEGTAGQLFSITNSLSGTIFSVNDVSGIPSIEVLDSGILKFGQYSGNVLIGTATDNGNKLRVAGPAHITQLGVGSSNNQSFDFYNNGTSYFNGSVTIDDDLSVSSGYSVTSTFIGRIPNTTGSGDNNAPFRFQTDYSGWVSLLAGSVGGGNGWGTFWAGNDNPAYWYFNSSNPNEYVFVGNGGLKASIDLDNGNSYFAGSVVTGGYFRRTASTNGYLEGNYSSAIDGNSSAAIYTIGGSYQPGSTNLGNMYGIGYTVGNGTSNPGLGLTGWGMYVAAAGTSRIFLDSDNGIGIASAEFRAPKFSDSNDTNYYVDPRSTSRLSGLRLDGVDNNASGDDYILWINKPNNNDWAIGVTGNLEYGIILRMAASHSYAISAQANGSEYSRLGTDLFYHNSNIRAPIFYDQDDTGFRADPNGTSKFNTLQFRSGSTDGPYFYYGNTQNLYLRGAAGSDVGLSMYDSSGNWTVQLYGASGAYGFLASNWGSWDLRKVPTGALHMNNNDNYYLNTTSTTSLRTVGSWRSDSASWDGEFSGKMQYHDNSWYLQYYTEIRMRNSGGTNTWWLTSGGSSYQVGNILIQNTEPTIYFLDTNHRSAMIHVNSDQFYILRGNGIAGTSWEQYDSYWPLTISLSTNNATFGGNIYRRNAFVPGLFIQDTAPTAYGYGDLWWESDTGKLKIYYYDGNTAQWVDAMPIPDTSTFFSKAGGSITGAVVINSSLTVQGSIFVGASGSQVVSSQYNSSLNSDSRNSRGVTRLYRRDDNSDYSVQTYWTGSYWRLYGYSGDSGHADTHVGYADSAGNADTVDGQHASAFAAASHSHDYVPERNRNDWNDSTVIDNVIGQLAWKNYGNNHIIFDASNSTAPGGTSINNTNASVPWGGTYPTLMGWNGSQTYGVRVDSARVADNGGVTSVNGQTGAVTISGGASLSNDTSTNNNLFYPTMAYNATSGTLSTAYVSSTKLYFNPSTGTLSATVMTSISDRNVKENIVTIENALSKTLSLRGVNYTLKDTQQKSIGVIAQEVEEILPEVVNTSDDGTKSVQYGNMIGLLIEAIKEQQKQIEDMKTEILLLKSR